MKISIISVISGQYIGTQITQMRQITTDKKIRNTKIRENQYYQCHQWAICWNTDYTDANSPALRPDDTVRLSYCYATGGFDKLNHRKCSKNRVISGQYIGTQITQMRQITTDKKKVIQKSVKISIISIISGLYIGTRITQMLLHRGFDKPLVQLSVLVP